MRIGKVRQGDFSGRAFGRRGNQKPVKIGKATTKGIILYTSGDNSIKAAMENGGIKKIHHVDYKTRSILGIVASQTTLVYGE